MGEISFNEIPIDFLPNATLVEIDNTRALTRAGINQKILVCGQRLTTGTVAAEELTLIRSTELADGYYGTKSQLAATIRAAKKLNKYTEMWACSLDDDGAANANTWELSFGTAPTGNGTLNLYVDGRRVRTAIDTTMSQADVASAVMTEINADTYARVTATIGGSTQLVSMVATNKGEVANHYDVRVNYYPDDGTPAGLSYGITNNSTGTANPDADSIWSVVGDEKFDYIIFPWTDSSNRSSLDTEMARKWDATVDSAGTGFMSASDTLGGLVTMGGLVNSKHFSIMGHYDSPDGPDIWAAEYGAVAAYYLNIDPARPIHTLPLNVKPPTIRSGNRWTFNDLNTLLNNGITGYATNQMGRVILGNVITTYQTNANGDADISYRSLYTMTTLAAIRTDIGAYINNKYPRAKLANDSALARISAGQAIVTPSIAKAVVIERFRYYERQGLVEDLDQFADDIRVERDANIPTRLNMMLPPNLMDQLIQKAIQIQFILN